MEIQGGSNLSIPISEALARQAVDETSRCDRFKVIKIQLDKVYIYLSANVPIYSSKF